MLPALLLMTAPLQDANPPLLLQHPTANATSVCFAFAGDLWDVPRAGGQARRLTVSPGIESEPHYSPDGKTIAFSGQYAGNTDVFVMPSEGGVPKRLTFHPGDDAVKGWSPDGKSVLFSTYEECLPFVPRLYTVPVGGGQTSGLPFPSGTMGSFSPDGKRIAYVPYFQFQPAWKRYRGGQAYPVWVLNLADSTWKELPRKGWNDKAPMWVGSRIFYLSDRAGKFDLWSSDESGGAQREALKSGSFGFTSASANGDTIALAEPGSIRLFDVRTGRASTVPVTVRGDFGEVREKYVPLASSVTAGDISPNGVRAVLEGRGEIVTIPADKGDARNLTNDSGSAERWPAWSPDGKTIAYFSDAGGEYKIVLKPSDGVGVARTINPGGEKGYYQNLVWSPDSKKLAYSDMRGILWVTDVESGGATKIDEAPYFPVTYMYQPSWSPDSKWLTFARTGENFLRTVFLYNLETAKLTPLTDGMSEASSPAFDKGGNYLYFLASTNSKTSTGWLDLSALETPNVTSNVYVVVLRNDQPSPFLPESDEEQTGEAPKPGEKPAFRIDLEGIGQRILAVPAPGRVYMGLLAGAEGSFFTVDVPAVANAGSNPGLPTLRKFDFGSKQQSTFAQMVQGVAVSASGRHMLIISPMGLSIVPTTAPPQPGQGALDLSSAMLRIDPRAEWRQIFYEVLRIQRDYFYDPTYHGVDLVALQRKYEPFLDGLASREDLNALFIDMLGELSVGHMYVGGGDIPGVQSPPIGFLGADYEIADGRYRFKKVYNGENWNPGAVAPLTQPGVNVRAGEFLLAVDGVELKGTDNIYARFEHKAGRQVRLRVGPTADGVNSREVTVVPVANDVNLRINDWVESNRRKVAELSNGRVGYLWLPNTSVAGYTYFNRYYYSQADKDGMVLDERFNGGGSVDDYFVEFATRPLMSWWATRYGKSFTSPLMSVYGPKALVTNQYAGSGGDYLPWAFRKNKLGPLVGKRTWGGLVGILGFPGLVDGGFVTSPNLAFFSPDGEWEIENYGVAPDIDIEWDPVLWRAGRDAQLERAVAEVMKALQGYKRPTPKLPAWKDNTRIGSG